MICLNESGDHLKISIEAKCKNIEFYVRNEILRRRKLKVCHLSLGILRWDYLIDEMCEEIKMTSLAKAKKDIMSQNHLPKALMSINDLSSKLYLRVTMSSDLG